MNSLVIIPAYNEERNIPNVLKVIHDLQLGVDVLVVNDGSADQTARAAQSGKAVVINLPFNLGYGGALQTGFKYAVSKGYESVITFDADGQHDPDDIKIILELLQLDVDIVIGSRFLGRGSFKTGWVKMAAIWMFRLIIRLTTKVFITDPSSGLQGLSRKAFSYYAMMGHFPPDYPDADILIQMLLSGYRVKEFPANMRFRSYGKSMHSGLMPIYYFLKMLVSILVVLLRKQQRGEA